MSVRLVWITPDAEGHIGYCARVSNPDNQDNPDVTRLLRYCIRKSHWSVFEMASMCLEIENSRIILDQVMRHRSFSFQAFSTRYAVSDELVCTRPRRQDTKNRQSSHDDLPTYVKEWFAKEQQRLWDDTQAVYKEALRLDVAKENARDLLPFATKSRIYMAGTIRSWIHYLDLRTDEETQLEHREIAEQARGIFASHLPTIAAALNWRTDG
jgi:thymidylate synthase (FAD)